MPSQEIPTAYPDRTVCIVGLGFVGLTLATVLADVGFKIIGVEVNPELCKRLKSGEAHFFEPGLTYRLAKCIREKRIEVHSQIPTNHPATVYIITVGTPLNAQKQIDLTSIQNVCSSISEHLKDGDLVLLRSTVKLGTTRSIALPLLKKPGKSFQLAFCPERTIEGQAMEELRHLPQIIGTDCPITALRAAQFFQFITPTVIRVRDFETAEMIKLIDNTKRDVMFAFSNEVAQMCNAAGLNAEEVICTGRFGYSRTDLPLPGPVGGPCLSKDPHILAQSMQEYYGLTPKIVMAARQVNEEQPDQVIDFLNLHSKTRNFPQNPIISLLGIAFKGKPATDDIRGTTAKPIYDALRKKFPKAEFRGFDPVVNRETISQFGLLPQATLQEAVSGAHLVLILNNHPLFSAMPIEILATSMANPGTIYDFWNHFKLGSLSLPSSVHYVTLGSHRFAETRSV